MKLKRAAMCGVLLWVLIFFEVSILMFGLNIQAPSRTYYLVHLPLLFILGVISSLVYFKGKVKGGAKNGLILGIIFVIIGMILDGIITVPLFVKDYSFFLKIEMLIGYLIILITTTIVGSLKK